MLEKPLGVTFSSSKRAAFLYTAAVAGIGFGGWQTAASMIEPQQTVSATSCCFYATDCGVGNFTCETGSYCSQAKPRYCKASS